MNEQTTGSQASGKMIRISKILQFVSDVFIIEFGLVVSSFGTALFYAANMGSSAMATFSDGLHRVLGMSYGNANMLANIAFLLVLILLSRKYIVAGTLLCVFTIGPWVNLFTPMLSAAGLGGWSVLMRLTLVLGGTALMGLGLGLYMAVDRGYGALEGIVQYVRSRTGLSVRVAKILQDAVLVVGGVLMGAAWGAGTLVAIVLTGPILHWSSRFFSEKVLKRST